MKFTKALETRRSIRSYTDKPVKKEDVKKILRAALLAPSWRNTQSSYFYVVMDDDRLATMKENCLSEGNARKVQNAPVLIVACYENQVSGYWDGQPATELKDSWGFFDLGLAVENILLQAAAMGLGTLVMGMRNEAATRKILSIPDTYTVGPVIALGHPETIPEMPQHKKLKEIVTFD